MAQQKKKNKNKLKPGVVLGLKIALVVFVAIALIFFAARMLGGLTLTSAVESIKIAISNLGEGDGYPYSVPGSGVRKAYASGNRLFAFSDDRTVLLSSSAKELSTETIEYGAPKIDYKDSKAIVYDTDSGKLRIQNTSHVVSTHEVDNNITCAAIGEKGNFAVATLTSNNQTVFTAFNKSGEEEFTWNFGSSLVTDIDLSSDGKYAVVSVINSVNAKTNSAVFVLKFDSEDYVYCADYPTEVVVSVRYVRGHDIEIITDKKRAYIEDNSTPGAVFSFESDTLNCADYSDSGYSCTALLKYGSDSKSVLKLFNKDKHIRDIDVDSEIKDISLDGKNTAVLTDDKAILYDKKGEVKGEAPVDASSTDIVLSGKKAYVFTPIEIVCVEF